MNSSAEETHVFLTEEQLDDRLTKGWRIVAIGDDGIDAVIAVLDPINHQAEWWAWHDIADRTSAYFDIDTEVIPAELQAAVANASESGHCVQLGAREVAHISHMGVRESDEAALL